MIGERSALAELAPRLAAAVEPFGAWSAPRGKGTVADPMTLPWYDFAPLGQAFLVAAGPWVTPGFAWPDWMRTEEAIRLRDDRAALAEATEDQLSRLITALLRSERFTEGSIAAAFESGLIAAIAARAAVLLAR